MAASFLSRAFRAAEARVLSDRLYVARDFKTKTGRPLDLKSPSTFNEKIQWLKINHKTKAMTKCADKAGVKEFISERVGENYTIPSLAVYNSVNEIDISNLTPPVILKATHGSGWNYFVRRAVDADNAKIKAYFKKWLKKDYFMYSREWAYKGICPRVLCEALMTDAAGNVPDDYKVFCFNGHAALIQVDHDRFSGHKRAFFDRKWQRKEFTIGFPISDKNISRPQLLQEMLDVSEVLAADFPFVRVDFLLHDGAAKIGELTFYPGNGMEKFSAHDWDVWMGSLLKLP